MRSGRLGKWKRGNFNSAFVEVWGAEKRQFYQCELGGWGDRQSDNFISASLGLGERKRDSFTSPILEGGGAERRQF